MRRSLTLVPVLALLVLTPAAVQAADEIVACNAPAEGTTVLKPNETKDSEPASPQLDAANLVDLGYSDTYTDVKFQLDLYPAKATDKATVTSTLNWTLDVNDWDLHLVREDEDTIKSEMVQFGPIADPPTETVQSKLLHCSLFTIRVYNYMAVAADDIDPLQLEVRAGSVTA